MRLVLVLLLTLFLPSGLLGQGFGPRGVEGLGWVWHESENGWNGVWTRRGESAVFDAVWIKGNERVTAVLTIHRNGPNSVTIERYDNLTNMGYDYLGTLMGDGTVQGTVRVRTSGASAPFMARIEERREPAPFEAPLQAGMRFQGQAVSTRSNRVWPAELVLQRLEGPGVIGELVWPNLNSRHRIEGTHHRGVLDFREVSAIVPGGAHLNVTYHTELRGRTLSGTWSDPAGDEGTLVMEQQYDQPRPMAGRDYSAAPPPPPPMPPRFEESQGIPGRVWQEEENGWHGVWTRRGLSEVFDAVYTKDNMRATAVLTMRRTGPATIVIDRKDNGTGFRYEYTANLLGEGRVEGPLHVRLTGTNTRFTARIEGWR